MIKSTNKELAKRVRTLRACIQPIINLEFKELLIEIEERLIGKVSVQKAKAKKSSNKRPTKQEIYNKYFYK